MQVIWSPAALRQVARINDYLVELNPYAAKRVVDELIAAGDSLANYPHRGRPVPNTELRELISTYPISSAIALPAMQCGFWASDIPRGGRPNPEKLHML